MQNWITLFPTQLPLSIPNLLNVDWQNCFLTVEHKAVIRICRPAIKCFPEFHWIHIRDLYQLVTWPELSESSSWLLLIRLSYVSREDGGADGNRTSHSTSTSEVHVPPDHILPWVSNDGVTPNNFFIVKPPRQTCLWKRAWSLCPRFSLNSHF